MTEKITIHTIEAENVKRLKAVSFHLTESGLTVIGGGNAEGKTSLLDAIAWTLGGERFRPSSTSSNGQARTRVELSNGLIVERKGKNGSLSVTDPSGAKSGQSILSEIIPVLALDLPKFMQASDKEKAKILLDILGVEEELQKLEEAEKALYADREALGREAKRASAYADELPIYEDAPKEIMTAQGIIQEQQAILLRNAEKAKARERKPQLTREIRAQQKKGTEIEADIIDRERRIAELEKEILSKKKELEAVSLGITELQNQLAAAEKNQADLQDESTAELEAQLADIEAANAKVRANREKAKARLKADDLEYEYKQMGTAIAELRKQIAALLNGAELPLPNLTVIDGELVYLGQKWDCMSGSEQLKVATAIVRKLNPACGFVLIDKLEQMDGDTLAEFGRWAQKEGLQIIGTRVSKGSECTLIIEDGSILEAAEEPEADYSICPIPGKYEGMAWADIPVPVRKYALENTADVPELTGGHIAAINASLK